MYGLPGSGKSYISRQLSDYFNMAHINCDLLRNELFDNPSHDAAENAVIGNLMLHMAEEFLKNGLSVVYDMSANRVAERAKIRRLAQANHAKELMAWVQIDKETAWSRCQSRDKRKIDDKYSSEMSVEAFNYYLSSMQNPMHENYLVLSGKHLFNSQLSAFLKRFREMGILNIDPNNQAIPKPGLVNLVSQAQNQAGRVDYARRNVIIR